MKRRLLGLALMIGSNSFAQDVQWSYQMNGEINDVVVDASGNSYTTGIFSGTFDFDPGAGVVNLTSNGSYDAFVTKMDAGGNLIWAKGIGSSSTDYGLAISVSTTGKVAFVGTYQTTMDLNPGVGTTTTTSNGMADAFVVVLDADGSYLWGHGFGGPETEYIRGVAFDASENVVFTGTYKTELAIPTSGGGTSTYVSTSGQYDPFIGKCYSTGGVQWLKTLGGNGYGEGMSIQTDASNNVYTCGFFSNDIQLDQTGGTSSWTSNGPRSSFITKLNASGNFVWGGAIMNSTWGQNEASSLAIDGNGDVLMLGKLANQADFDLSGSSSEITGTANSAYVVKYSASGSLTWAHPITAANLYTTGICVDASNIVYSTGYFSSTIDANNDATDDLSSPTTYIGCIIKHNADGNFISASQVGDGGDAYVYASTASAGGNLILVGSLSGNGDYDPSSATYSMNSSDGTGFMVKYGSCAADYSTDSHTACGSFTWIDGYTYSSDNTTATHTLQNISGCDSIVTLNLTILEHTTSTETVNALDAYTWTVNNQTYTSSGTYTAVIPNTAGCDSTITLDLTLQFTGLNELEKSIKVYPNPVDDILSIEVEMSEPISMTIYTLTGKVVKELSITQTKTFIDLSDLITGVYIIRLHTDIEPIRIMKL